jgi:hypothetical protein
MVNFSCKVVPLHGLSQSKWPAKVEEQPSPLRASFTVMKGKVQQLKICGNRSRTGDAPDHQSNQKYVCFRTRCLAPILKYHLISLLYFLVSLHMSWYFEDSSYRDGLTEGLVGEQRRVRLEIG